MEERTAVLQEAEQLRGSWEAARSSADKTRLWSEYSYTAYRLLSLHQRPSVEAEVERDVASFNALRQDVVHNGRPGKLDLREQTFAGYRLAGADFSFTDLSGANFTGAVLEGANLMGAICRGATFNAIHGQRIDLFKTDCREASFLHADLQNAQCPMTIFRQADLSWSSLRDAAIGAETQLGTTRLFDCDLEGSTLEKARGCLIMPDLMPVMRPEERAGERERAIDVYDRLARYFTRAARDDVAQAFKERAEELRRRVEQVRSVFISYARESNEHGAWVKRLAERLRQHGLTVYLDESTLRPGDDFETFMGRLEAPDRVIVVCTERYAEKAELDEGGVAEECRIMRRLIQADKDMARLIPIIRGRGESMEDSMPPFLTSKKAVDFRDDHRWEESLQELLRALIPETAATAGQ